MIAAGILHPQSWHWNVLAWLTGFLIVLIGAVGALLVTVALRSGRGSPLQRSFFAFGPAAFAPAIFFVFLRLVQLVEPAFGPGPQHWLIGWLPGHANDFVHPYDTLVAVHLFSAGVTAVFAVLVALLFPPNPSRRWTPALPGRTVAAVLLGGCALLVVGRAVDVRGERPVRRRVPRDARPQPVLHEVVVAPGEPVLSVVGELVEEVVANLLSAERESEPRAPHARARTAREEQERPQVRTAPHDVDDVDADLDVAAVVRR
ncbi:MAG: hypothetical protein KC656_23130, partial [Myxococcales bacterium]|nr:hypothetical protein [Myxococcales bacterium]